jgi:hypothetical protein
MSRRNHDIQTDKSHTRDVVNLESSIKISTNGFDTAPNTGCNTNSTQTRS